MKIALYRSAHGGFFDKTIDFLSGNKGFSHCELVFSDGQCFSSSFRDPGVRRDGSPKPNGTRFKTVEFDPEKWVFYPLLLQKGQEAYLWEYAHTLLDGQYDFKGALRFVWPGIKQSPYRWFCSEAVVDVVQRGGYFIGEKSWMIAPNDIPEHLQ